MRIFDRLKSLIGLESRATYSLRDPALVTLFGGHGSDAGVVVTESIALQSAGVWSAVRVISETVASLPLILYEHGPNGARKRASHHPLYEILLHQPCGEISALVWTETLMHHVLLYGNAFAEIERDSAGNVLELKILRPDWMTVVRNPFSEMLNYEYMQPQVGRRVLQSRDVFHIKGLGFDGMLGYSVIKMARESIGLTMASERFGAKFFGAGARPSGALTHPGRLSDDARGRLRQDFERLHQGVNNAHRVAVLEEGMTWSALGIPPEDAQFLQTRQFQLAEIARWFNIPLSKLRDSSSQSYSTMEMENMVFLTETLRPWLIRIEQEVRAKLLNTYEQSCYYAEHQIEDLLRADQSARYAAYAVGRNWGWLSVNEIRAKENLEPIEGGDVYMQPLNMQPINAPTGPSAPSSSPAVGSVTPADTPTTAGENSIDEPEETNDLPVTHESVVRLAAAMTEHQIMSCEHGSTNRCRICGIERERELVPPEVPGGEHGWRIKWRPIGTPGAQP
jgi:HK97 family phage portal protein